MALTSILAFSGYSDVLEWSIGPMFNVKNQLDSYTYNSEGMDFSPDGTMLAVISDGKLHVYDVGTKGEIASLSLPSTSAKECAFSPDGSMLAAAHSSGDYVSVFDTGTWQKITGVPAAGGNGRGCAFSPDGSILAIGHYSSPYLTLIDTAAWQVMSGPTAIPGNCWSCDFSHDGELLGLGHDGGSGYTVLRMTDFANVTPAGTSVSAGEAVEFSGDGRFFAACGNGVTIFTVEGWAEAHTLSLPSTAYGCSFGENSQLLAVAHNGAPYLTLVNTTDWTIKAGTPAPKEPGNLRGCAFSPSINLPSRQLEVRDANGDPAASKLMIYNAEDGGFLWELESENGEFEVINTQDSRLWGLAPNPDPASQSDQFATIKLDHESESLPPIALFRDYTGSKATISSNLTTQSGAPGDEVVIRNWTTRELVAKVIPDANGDWSADVPPGTYDVSYIAENCAPVIHGPYTVELP